MKKFIFMLVALFATVSMSAQHVVESKFFDNTYVSVNLGGTIQTPLFEGVNDLNKVKPIVGVEIGKDFTTLYGMSIEGKSTINNKGVHTIFDDLSVTWKHKFNLSNAIWGYNEDRAWEMKLVGAAGWGHDNGCVVKNYLVAEAGAEVNYNISNKCAFNIKPSFMWEHAEHGLNVNNSEIELLVGFTYKFPKRGFTICDKDVWVSQCDELNAKVNELRIENEKVTNELTNATNLIAEKDKIISELQNKPNTVTNVVVPSVVGFEIGKSDILSTHEASLVTLANFLKENDDLKVEVVGHADAKTGTSEINQRLSVERANTVKNVLVNLGVDANRITTIGKGDTEQLFEKNESNRVVITLVK